MYARITTLRTTAAQHDEGARIVAEDLVPWAQNASGYCGLLRLDSREAGTTLVVTLWSTLGALEQSGEAPLLADLGEAVLALSGVDLLTQRLRVVPVDIAHRDSSPRDRLAVPVCPGRGAPPATARRAPPSRRPKKRGEPIRSPRADTGGFSR